MYAILITVPLDAIVHAAFLLWLWYRITYPTDTLPMIEYTVPTAIPSAPIYSFSDSGSESIPGKGGM